jgi:hypothetical protein
MGEKSANRLRYATLTGTVVIRWDGAHQPDIWNVPAPDLTPLEARLELARRYMHVFGPATPNSFARWAGIDLKSGVAAFQKLEKSLTQVRTPIGDAWILSLDETEFRANSTLAAPARLLPSGDTWFLLQGADRDLLVPDKRQRGALWTSRVWPGALLVDGETAGTWRRAGHLVTVQPWRSFSKAQRLAIESEARSLPLPGIERPIEISWEARLR